MNFSNGLFRAMWAKIWSSPGHKEVLGGQKGSLRWRKGVFGGVMGSVPEGLL